MRTTFRVLALFVISFGLTLASGRAWAQGFPVSQLTGGEGYVVGEMMPGQVVDYGAGHAVGHGHGLGHKHAGCAACGGGSGYDDGNIWCPTYSYFEYYPYANKRESFWDAIRRPSRERAMKETPYFPPLPYSFGRNPKRTADQPANGSGDAAAANGEKPASDAAPAAPAASARGAQLPDTPPSPPAFRP